MNDDAEFDPYLPFFDLSPAGFPWTASRQQAVADSRNVTGSLFLDELLGMAAVDASLYPPKDTLTLRHLIISTLSSEFDRLKKDCLVYYLLLDYPTKDRAEAFKVQRGIPTRFVSLTEGYWFLDNKQHENAVKSLTLPSLTPDFVPKILATLSLHPVPSTAAQLVLKFLRLATPDLTSDQEVDIKVDALARVNFREAWEFVESLNVGERKQALVKRVIVATLSPKPVPAHLQLLLAFPFSQSSEQTLHALCLHPPSGFSQASTKVLHDLAHTRLIAQGRLLDAIRLDRAIGSGREGDARRETIERLVRIVPEVQRRILEAEMGGGEGKDKKANGIQVAQITPALPAVAPIPTPAPSVFQHAANAPLSASQKFRTSSPRLPFASGSTSAVPRDPIPSHYFPQRPQPSSPANSPARPPQAVASPFAQAAKQVSQAAFRSSVIGRDQRARQESSPRVPQAVYQRPVESDEEDNDDEMLVVESPPPAVKKSSSRRAKETPLGKNTRTARAQTESKARQGEDEEDDHDEVDSLPGGFPGGLSASTTKTPTTARRTSQRSTSAAKAPAPPASRPARGARAPSVPGSFTTGASTDESGDDERRAEEVQPARRTKRGGPPPPASFSGYGLRKGHVRTRSMSVASDSGEDDGEDAHGKTPPPSMRRRTLRSSVTVSPEAVRQATSIKSGGRSTKTAARGGSKLKESSTAPTRRSTRRAGGGDE